VLRVDLVDLAGWGAGERSAGREQEADARYAPLHLQRAGAQQHLYGATRCTTWPRLVLIQSACAGETVVPQRPWACPRATRSSRSCRSCRARAAASGTTGGCLRAPAPGVALTPGRPWTRRRARARAQLVGHDPAQEQALHQGVRSQGSAKAQLCLALCVLRRTLGGAATWRGR